MQKTDPTQTKLLRLEYERHLIRLFKNYIKNVIPRLKPVIYNDSEKLTSSIQSYLAVADFETIIDEEFYYNVEIKLNDEVKKYINQSYKRGVNKAVKEINKGKQQQLNAMEAK